MFDGIESKWLCDLEVYPADLSAVFLTEGGRLTFTRHLFGGEEEIKIDQGG